MAKRDRFFSAVIDSVCGNPSPSKSAWHLLRYFFSALHEELFTHAFGVFNGPLLALEIYFSFGVLLAGAGMFLR